MKVFNLTGAKVNIVPTESIMKLDEFSLDHPVAKLAKLNKRVIGAGFRLAKVSISSNETDDLSKNGFRVGDKTVYSSACLFPVSMLRAGDDDGDKENIVLPGYYINDGNGSRHECTITAQGVTLPLSSTESLEEKMRQLKKDQLR